MPSLTTQAPDLRKRARKPILVPEVTPTLDVLEQFQQSGEQMALVVDEHGGIQGVVTLTDLMQAVVGDVRGPGESGSARIVRRDDRTWLVDG